MKTIGLFIFLSLFSILFLTIQAQPNEWTSLGIGGGGALFSPSYNPSNPDEIIVASDLGGLFHTENSGGFWEVEPFWNISSATSSKMNFTDDPDVRYCITTNGFQFFPTKTTNGGQTWAVLPDEPTFGDTWGLFADPDDAQRVLIGAYSELLFSSDGGLNFESVYSASDLYIGGVFWDGDHIFVGCRTGLLVSSDGGGSFQLEPASGDLPNDFGMLSLTGAKAGNTIRLFGVARTNDSMWPGMHGSEFWANQDIFRLDWGNASGWERLNNGLPIDDFPFFIDMAQNNVEVVYVAGSTAWPNFPLVYKSEDGGQSWNNVFRVDGNENIATGWQCNGGDQNWWWGENAMGFEVAPNDPDRAVITDFGFIHLTTDGGTNWRQTYVNPVDENPPGDTDNVGQYYTGVGMEPTTAWWVHWSDSENIFSGFSDITGIRSQDHGLHWSFDYSGNDWNSTYHIIEHPATGTLYAAVSDIHDIYQSTRLSDNPLDGGAGAVLYSEDMGVTWKVLRDFGHPVVWLVLHPGNPDVLYASVIHSTDGDIYVTENLQNGTSANWERLASPPRTEGHPFNIHVLNDGTLVTTYSGRIDDDGSFTLGSGVFVSQDGGHSWEDRTHPDMQRWTKDLLIATWDENTWYASVFSHWGAWPNEVGGLYKTTDRGQTWTVLGDFYRVESCFALGTDKMYVTTESEGLWYSENISDPNPTFSLLKDYPFWHPLRVFLNPYRADVNELWVTSFGNGLRVGSDTGVPGKELNNSPVDIKVFPNPAKDTMNIRVKGQMGGGTIELFNAKGQLVLENQMPNPSNYFSINSSRLRRGVYWLKVTLGNGIWNEKVIVH